jgi:5-methylcytosine-specific restriction endonuclease McrA
LFVAFFSEHAMGDTATHCVILNSQHSEILDEFAKRCAKDNGAKVVFQPHTPNRLRAVETALDDWGGGLPIFFVEGRYGKAVTAEGCLIALRYSDELSAKERISFRRLLAKNDTPFTPNLVVASNVQRLPRAISLTSFRKVNDGLPPRPHQWPATVCHLPRGITRHAMQPEALAEEVSALEGQLRERMIRHRYREARLRRAKIKAVLASEGTLRCEVRACGFDFRHRYGLLGMEYAQVHHLSPIAGPGPKARTLDDLSIVCANCHAMIHRNGECHTIAEIDRAMRRACNRAPTA